MLHYGIVTECDLTTTTEQDSEDTEGSSHRIKKTKVKGSHQSLASECSPTWQDTTRKPTTLIWKRE